MKTIIKNAKTLALVLTMIFGINAISHAQVKTAIKTADLQKSITDQIAKDYAGYAIKDAFKVDHNKVITYQVDVMKDNKTMCLAYNNNGKFLKVIEPKAKANNMHKNTAMNTHTKTKKVQK